MIMTSGRPISKARLALLMGVGTIMCKSCIDAGRHIMTKDHCSVSQTSNTVNRLTRTIQAGAGANILRGAAGAGVLALYDQYSYSASSCYPLLTPNASTDFRNSLGERCTRLDLVDKVPEDLQCS